MRYSIKDPFVYYDRDFTILRAAFIELVIRKLLDENGFKHQNFYPEFMPYTTYDDFSPQEAIGYMKKVFEYMGYIFEELNFDEIDSKFASGDSIQVKILLKELDGLSSIYIRKHEEKWLNIMNEHRFYSVPCELAIQTREDKQAILEMTFDEEFYYEWYGIADLIFNFCELRKSIMEVLNTDDYRELGSGLGDKYPVSAK